EVVETDLDADDEGGAADEEAGGGERSRGDVAEEDDSAAPPARLVDGPPPPLLALATRIVAANLERYPPASLGRALSEAHWEGVVRARASSSFARGGGGRGRGRGDDDGSTPPPPPRFRLGGTEGAEGARRLPPPSAKILRAIESHPANVHLARSTAADESLWKEVVNRRFSGGMSRPSSLEVPRAVVEERLRKWGEELTELSKAPLGREEWEAANAPQTARAGAKAGGRGEKRGCSGAKHGRDEELEELFGRDDDEEERDDDEEEAPAADDDEEDEGARGYQSYLERESDHRTIALIRVLISLRTAPVDVELLASTGVGKVVGKVVKAAKKRDRGTREEEEVDGSRGGTDRSTEEEEGRPRFREPVAWSSSSAGSSGRRGGGSDDDLVATPLEFLRRLLRDWKDAAAAENDDADDPPSPPSKRRKAERGGASASSAAKAEPLATCGKDPKLSTERHRRDMELLRGAPDWRSLYRALELREGEMRRSHGDRVRGIRERLEEDRRKIGKVVLKRAVGRVRGGGGGGEGDRGAGAARGSAAGVAGRRAERREAILSKSLGNKARQQQRRLSGGASSSSGGGKLSQIRKETRTAAARSGRSSEAGSSFGRSVAAASFGASVARAGGNGGRPRQAQVRVQMRGGRQMTIPAAPSSAGAAKTVGVFSSLQQKKARQQGEAATRPRPAGSAGPTRPRPTSSGSSVKTKPQRHGMTPAMKQLRKGAGPGLNGTGGRKRR
ncbi:hypothetical protein ACHAWF_016138, partial [Thalassiosira exigua]